MIIELKPSILGICLLLVAMAGCAKPPANTAKPATPGAMDRPAMATGRNAPLGIPETPLPPEPLAVSAPRLPPKVEKPLVHKVRYRRETLFSISQWYTGSGNNWRRLADANPKIRPHSIRVGDTILIPTGLLKTRQPMPAKFLGPARKKTTPARPRTPAATSDKLPLIGPVDEEASPEKRESDNALPVPLETLD